MNENQLATIALDVAFDIHRNLGPGLLESAYQKIMLHELKNKGLNVKSELYLPVKYKDVNVDLAYRLDLVLNDKVVLELKTVEAIRDVHQAQILTYLKLGGYNLGLIINFHTALLKNGIKRYIF